MINKTHVVNRLVLLTEVILCLNKWISLNFHEFQLDCGFYGSRRNSGLALYLKVLVLMTTINVPNFMLVSEAWGVNRNRKFWVQYIFRHSLGAQYVDSSANHNGICWHWKSRSWMWFLVGKWSVTNLWPCFAGNPLGTDSFQTKLYAGLSEQ